MFGAFCVKRCRDREFAMPIHIFVLLLTAVILAAGATIALAYVLGVNFVWLAVVALLAAVLVRRWT